MNVTGGKKILVVDDEAVIASQLEDLLEHHGYTVVGTAYSGSDAVEKARNLIPDLVLMDIVMPGEMDGVDACKAIQEELGTPVVFVSAYSGDPHLPRATRTTPYGYVVKPYQDEQVRCTIETALQKKQWEEELTRASLDAMHRSEGMEIKLREVHHRIKNSLQLITDFMAIKGMEIQDRSCTELLDEVRSKVLSIAKTHERIYRSDSPDAVRCAEYLAGLEEVMRSSFLYPAGVKLSMNADDTVLAPEKVMLVGLMVNELVSNSIKHAFDPKGRGRIDVELVRQDGQVLLRVADDGRGLPEDLEDRKRNSLGLELVERMAKQLSGTLEIQEESGTVFLVRFPVGPS